MPNDSYDALPLEIYISAQIRNTRRYGLYELRLIASWHKPPECEHSLWVAYISMPSIAGAT